ncbi:MAG TPA: PAS domain S-box protein, partial [Kofleriaceae bacterium]
MLTSQRSAPPPSALDSDGELHDNDNDDTQRFALGTREIRHINLPRMTDDGEPLTLARASFDVELASVPHATFVINPTGQIEYVNELAAALSGYTRAELIGQTIGRIVSDIAGPVAETRARDATVRFVPAASGACVHHRSGRELPASVVLGPHGHGSVIALVTPLTTVTTPEDCRDSWIAELVHDFKSPLATIALEMCVLDHKLKCEPQLGLLDV